jgi:RimJ/RimL family protein N-acetyltransferase
VEIGYTLAPPARGKGIGTTAVAGPGRMLATVPGTRQVTAVTGAQNTPSRRLPERQEFQITGSHPAGQVRHTLGLG